ncbi:hypothetical protein [Methanolobus psychrotolerans]|uniref:hypothetical protein n=1 Tax=Methanolobus psychrotolerans TaxID=1874706 RepID=UPI001F5C78E2|nr:hypothetical protein [Methanolobus psychrotolerans]
MTGQVEKNDLEQMMNSVHNGFMGHMGINEAQFGKLVKLSQEEVLLGASKDITFKMAVKNGKGHASASQTTAWISISGYFEITSPDEGTWNVIVKDGNNTILSQTGVKKGQRIDIIYKTGFSVNLSLDATWSESKDTTLAANIRVTY